MTVNSTGMHFELQSVYLHFHYLNQKYTYPYNNEPAMNLSIRSCIARKKRLQITSPSSKIPLHPNTKTCVFRHRNQRQHLLQLWVCSALTAQQNIHRVMPLLQVHCAAGLQRSR